MQVKKHLCSFTLYITSVIFFLRCDHIPDKKQPKGRRDFWLLVLRVRMHHAGNAWWQKVQAASHATFAERKKMLGVRECIQNFKLTPKCSNYIFFVIRNKLMQQEGKSNLR